MSNRKTPKVERPLVYELVKIDHNEVVTDSRIIAERFDKDHPNVLKAIRAIINGPVSRVKNNAPDRLTDEQKAVATALRKDFAKNFRETTYKDERGKDQPMFLLNNDAARKLIMGFTGEKAEVWQFLFVRAFSEMEKELGRQRQNHADPTWNQARAIGKGERRNLTDACQDFESYGLDDRTGSGMSYNNYTRLIQRALFRPEDGIYKNLRPRLTDGQLLDLGTVERTAARKVREAMENGLPRDQVYPFVKETVQRMAGDIGVSTVPPLEDAPALPGLVQRAA